MRAVLWRWGPLLVALLVNLWGVYAPSEPGGVSLFPDADKVGHLVIFGALAWAAVRAGVPVRWVAAILVLHAVESEIVQGSLLPHRDGDWHDALADVLGVIVGIGLAAARRPRGSRRPAVARDR